MVYTVTFNPAIDYVVHTAEMRLGEVNRSSSEEMYFGGKGIVFQLDKRGKRMAVPQINGIHIVARQHVEILNPEVFVVEPREILRRIRIFIHGASRQENGFLHSDAGSAQFHLGRIGDSGDALQRPVHAEYLQHFVHTIDGSRRVVARDGDMLALAHDGESFGFAGIGHGYLEFILAVDAVEQTGCVFRLWGMTLHFHLHFGRKRQADG